MALLPLLPVIAGESLTSYMARIAKFHCDSDVYSFLSMFELSRQDVMFPSEEVIERISLLTGQGEAVLKRMTFLRQGGRVRTICGETVHSEFANLEQTSFCPACLLEDGHADSASAGMRVGRIGWLIEPSRTCPNHGILLRRYKNLTYSKKFQLMSDVAPNDNELREMVANSDKQKTSELQSYIQQRLEGVSGSPWLDNQQIDQASRACEMLGVILTAGTHCNLKKISQAEWNEAGDLGFGFASRGEEGIREGLRLAFDRFIERDLHGGPQKVFGRLYQWLQFNTNGKEFGPIRGVVREFIVENFVLEIGMNLLGSPVEQQAIHSVYSLSQKTGMHPKTINRAAVYSGLVQGDPDRSLAHLTFDAKAGEELVLKMQNALPTLRIPEYLNCNRVQAQQLVRSGVIPRIGKGLAGATGVLKHVAKEDLDQFLDRIVGQATQVDCATDGLFDIVSTAEIARWPVLDIVNGILAGAFSKLEIVDVDLKFKGILMDPNEVCEVLSEKLPTGQVSANEAARILGMNTYNLRNLAKLLDPDGKPYLTEHFIKKNSKGVQVSVFMVDELLAFLRTHVSLKDYAEMHIFSPKVMKMKLDGRGLKPIVADHSLGRFFYRKADIAA
ncbi:TniQ family protein [uncultured Sulfitobacter sp.]|uniref:TniQ family protein n=1 Tax=uncultured Sulfitobacter sp. TaxID=191468 RepID=UPI00260C79EE|nr:TniQ family protein [uncultured Sulfitobacter sp.]